MRRRCPAHARRSRAARITPGLRSPVLASRRRLRARLLLFFRLHIALFARRAAEQLVGLLLAKAALRLRRLALRRLVRLPAAPTSTAPAPAASTLLLAQ